MKKIIPILTLCCLCSMALQAQSSDELKIKFQVRELNKAIFETRDSAVLAELMHDSLSYGHSNGKVEGKAATIEHVLANKNRYDEIQMTQESLTIESRTAIARHDFIAVQSVDGKKSDLHLRVIQVWVKGKSDWKLLARQTVKIDPAK